MADQVKCPECDERVELTAALRKKGAACPTCGAALGKFVPPAPAVDTAKPQPTRRKRRRDDDDDDDYDHDHPRPRARPPGDGNAAALWGLVLVVALVVGGASVMLYVIRNNRAKDGQPNGAGAPANPVPSPGLRQPPGPPWQGSTDTTAAEAALPPARAPFEVDPLLAQDARPVYLADMREFAVRMGPWALGKGTLGEGPQTPLRVNGERALKGLGVSPWDRAATRVAYALGGKATTLVGSVALNDADIETYGPVVFKIVGDGRELWKSGPTTRAGGPTSFRVDVSGVKVLELRAIALGAHNAAHAVWVDPHIEK